MFPELSRHGRHTCSHSQRVAFVWPHPLSLVLPVDSSGYESSWATLPPETSLSTSSTSISTLAPTARATSRGTSPTFTTFSPLCPSGSANTVSRTRNGEITTMRMIQRNSSKTRCTGRIQYHGSRSLLGLAITLTRCLRMVGDSSTPVARA